MQVMCKNVLQYFSLMAVDRHFCDILLCSIYIIKMQKISGFLFFSQFCITCIVQGRWNGAFISNISFYLNEILIVTLKCHYRNTIAIVKMGAIVTPRFELYFGERSYAKILLASRLKTMESAKRRLPFIVRFNFNSIN